MKQQVDIPKLDGIILEHRAYDIWRALRKAAGHRLKGPHDRVVYPMN